MEPERRDTYTHIERDRRGSGMAFILGGLVVAVAVIALIVWGAPFGTGEVGDAEVEVSTQTEVPATVPEPVVGNQEEVGAGQADLAPAGDEVEVEIETAPATPAEPVPAQN